MHLARVRRPIGVSPGVPSPFTPRSLSGLKLWLPADRISGLVDGDPVATWGDLSGQGNHATQGTGAAKPLFKTNIANGRPGVLGDGVDDFLTLAAGACTALMAGDRTIFLVTKWVTHGANRRVISLSNAGGGTRCAISEDGAGAGAAWAFVYSTGAAARTITAVIGAVPSANTTQISEAVQSGVNYTGLTNGTQVGTAADASVEAAGVGTLFAGAGGTNNFGNLYLMEVVAYSAALSAADRARVRRYLGAKYSVAVS